MTGLDKLKNRVTIKHLVIILACLCVLEAGVSVWLIHSRSQARIMQEVKNHKLYRLIGVDDPFGGVGYRYVGLDELWEKGSLELDKMRAETSKNSDEGERKRIDESLKNSERIASDTHNKLEGLQIKYKKSYVEGKLTADDYIALALKIVKAQEKIKTELEIEKIQAEIKKEKSYAVDEEKIEYNRDKCYSEFNAAKRDQDGQREIEILKLLNIKPSDVDVLNDAEMRESIKKREREIKALLNIK